MDDTSDNFDFDNDHQIRLLMNLREDIRNLLGAHPKGIWFRMLPKVFYMHFQRDIHLDMFAIPNPLFFLDYIADIIRFDLSDNLDEEDFIIELNTDEEENLTLSKETKDLKAQRETLLKRLEKANLRDRGGLLREICCIDEYLKQVKSEEPKKAPSPKGVVFTREQVALRLQKIRSMVDFSLRYLLQTSNEISNEELGELYRHVEEFIDRLKPVAQHLSSTISET